MSYQKIQQENNRTRFVNLENGEDTLTITAERVNMNVSGYKIPGTRINMLSQEVEAWNPPGCTDPCAAPAYIGKTVRMIISGPTMSKASLIALLEQQIAILRTSDFDPVWMGFSPTGDIITTPVV